MVYLRSITLSALLAVGLLACQQTPGPNPGNPPVIASFTAQPLPVPAGVPTTFSWSVQGSQLTCKVDVHGDGVVDFTVNNCTSSSTVSHTYPAQSSYVAQLTVTNATGQSSTRTLPVVVGPANLAPLITGFWVGQSTTLETVAFYWAYSDPDGPTPTCRLDADSNGTWDYQGSCLGLNQGRPYPVRTTFRFNDLDNYDAILQVSDGYQISERRLSFRVPLNRVPIFERANLRAANSPTGLVLSFEVSDPDKDPIRCTITPPQGAPVQINSCSSHSLGLSIPEPGLYSVLIEASDGREEATQTLSVDTRNLCTPEISFPTSQDFLAGVSPIASTSGDLDGDGYPEVAVANYSSATVSVFRGSATGLTIPRQDLVVGNAPSSVILPDLDGDGRPDLVSANWGADTLAILRNLGQGNFGPAQTVLSSEAPSQVISANLNGDSSPDLVVANSESDRISIFLGGSSGQLGTRKDIAVGISPQGVTAADFDQDGRTDLAVVLAGENTVVILPGIGNGNFGSHQHLNTENKPVAVRAALLDDDDKPDLVVVNQLSHSLSIYLSTALGGLAADPVHMSVGLLPVAVVAHDLNGDGAIDLAVANSGSDTVSLILGAGNGLFGGAQLLTTRGFPSSVEVIPSYLSSLPALMVTSRAENYLQIFPASDAQQCGGATLRSQDRR